MIGRVGGGGKIVGWIVGVDWEETRWDGQLAYGCRVKGSAASDGGIGDLVVGTSQGGQKGRGGSSIGAMEHRAWSNEAWSMEEWRSGGVES